MGLESEVLKKYDVSADGFIDLHEFVAARLFPKLGLNILRNCILFEGSLSNAFRVRSWAAVPNLHNNKIGFPPDSPI